jgi:hypothetical protein
MNSTEIRNRLACTLVRTAVVGATILASSQVDGAKAWEGCAREFYYDACQACYCLSTGTGNSIWCISNPSCGGNVNCGGDISGWCS